MGLKAVVQNCLSTFSSLGRVVKNYADQARNFELTKLFQDSEDKDWKMRLKKYVSRKIVLVTLLALALLYFFGPYIFGFRQSQSVPRDPTDECLAQALTEFQLRFDNLDAFSSGDFDFASASKKLAYVGNGFLAAAFGSDNGLYIRIFRALSQPVKYWPIIQTHVAGSVKETSVLNIRSGLAHKRQVLATPAGCLNIGSVIYAHRSRPSLLVQDVHIQNPSLKTVSVELDQIRASGWEGVSVKLESYAASSGDTVKYTVYSGQVPVLNSEMKIAIAIASVNVASQNIIVEASSTKKFHFLTAINYSKPLPEAKAQLYLPSCIKQVKVELENALNINERILRQEHIKVWGKLWHSGFSISPSLAVNALNGDLINKTLYYVVSNSPAPLHNIMSTAKEKLEIEKVLYFPDRCYEGHSTLVSETLWINPEDESQIARLVTTWMITLEKQGCALMAEAGAEGILQAMILSLGPLRFNKLHLELNSHPNSLHRDIHFRRINYGNITHVNISVVLGEDNKAALFVALDKYDRPYYGCDAGCIDPPVLLSAEPRQFPVKLTDPVTPILYVTPDKRHLEELKHAIHVKEIVEAPAHEHHVIALHKHGHHLGGLPTAFWVSMIFLFVVFHLFLFKLIYSEYFQGKDRFIQSRYSL